MKKNSAIKGLTTNKNSKCIYGGDEIIFVVKKDGNRSQAISKPGEVNSVDVHKTSLQKHSTIEKKFLIIVSIERETFLIHSTKEIFRKIQI